MEAQVHPYDQVVYLLQGGGALGAYQVGVCQVLLEHDFFPDWVVGTSIGAINASLIAGSRPQDRTAHLQAFWEEITLPLPETSYTDRHYLFREWQNYFSAAYTIVFGQNNFFMPRWYNPWWIVGGRPDQISFYDTSILRATLEKYIDFDLINSGVTRLTLGAVSVGDGEQITFDSLRQKLGPEHVMASCALPPGFPAIEIDGRYYWDGGVMSNTPLSIILREHVPQKLLCFMVNLFTNNAELPATMVEVIKRKKDLSLTSQHHEVVNYLCHLHEYQHLIYRLNQEIKDTPRNDLVCKTIKAMSELGHPTACNIVRFHYVDNLGDTWAKDFEFSLQSVHEHLRRGQQDALEAMKHPQWLESISDDAGVVMHDFIQGVRV